MERLETVKQCQLCELKTSSMSFLLRHLTTVHSTRPGFCLSCGLNGCQRTFSNITTYKHHVYAKHSKYHTNLSSTADSTELQTGHNGSDSEQDEDDDFGGTNISEGLHDDEYEQEGNIIIIVNLPLLIVALGLDDMKEAAASWILKTKEKHRIPQSAINTIIQDVTVFFQMHLSRIYHTIKQQLKSADVDENISSLSPIFDPNGHHGRPFKGLETEYLQLKFFKRKFSMIVSATEIVYCI